MDSARSAGSSTLLLRGECRNSLSWSAVIAAPIIAAMFTSGTQLGAGAHPCTKNASTHRSAHPGRCQRRLSRAGIRGWISRRPQSRAAVHPRRTGERDVRGQGSGSRWSPADGRPPGVVHLKQEILPAHGNSILFVGAVTFALSVAGLIGVETGSVSTAVNASGILALPRLPGDVRTAVRRCSCHP